MPGIVGLISKKPRELAERELSQMVKAIQHEKFYKAGTWIDESMGVYVGWVAREGSFSDNMPIKNRHEDVVLIFSGEEYRDSTDITNHWNGHKAADSRTSYLVQLYEEDPSFPKCLNGRFQGLISDKTRGTVMLFNDRYGMQRIYYHESDGAFYFAAEAKAILAVRPELRRLDTRGLGEYASCGCVLENRTLFRDIYVLPPASSWMFCSGFLKAKSAYFAPNEWEQQSSLDPEAYHENIRDIFSRNLPRYLNGYEQIGMSLTGGLDTRTVMAWQRFPAGSLPCYTYGEKGKNCRDVTVARKVARKCQQLHQVVTLDKEFFSHFPYYAERSLYLTDACVDVTRAPDLYLSEKAREIAPVRMTGLYGDEVLRPQLRAFKPVSMARGLFQQEFLSRIAQAWQTYTNIINVHPTSFAVFRQAPWHHFGILSLEQTQLTVRTPFLDNDFVQTVFRAPESARANNDLRVRLIGDGSKTLQRLQTDRGFAGSQGPILSWASQNFWEFTFRAEYAYDYGMPQWLARVDHFVSPLRLERLFLGRHKIYHYRVWYRNMLATYVRDMLLDARSLTRPYLDKSQVETIVQGHLRGNRNYTIEIHRLLSLELIHRLFVDSR